MGFSLVLKDIEHYHELEVIRIKKYLQYSIIAIVILFFIAKNITLKWNNEFREYEKIDPVVIRELELKITDDVTPEQEKVEEKKTEEVQQDPAQEITTEQPTTKKQEEPLPTPAPPMSEPIPEPQKIKIKPQPKPKPRIVKPAPRSVSKRQEYKVESMDFAAVPNYDYVKSSVSNRVVRYQKMDDDLKSERVNDKDILPVRNIVRYSKDSDIKPSDVKYSDVVMKTINKKYTQNDDIEAANVNYNDVKLNDVNKKFTESETMQTTRYADLEIDRKQKYKVTQDDSNNNITDYSNEAKKMDEKFQKKDVSYRTSDMILADADRMSKSIRNAREAEATKMANEVGSYKVNRRARADLQNAPKPPYPTESRVAGHQGLVVLLADIDENGQVTAVVIAQSSGYSELDESARDTVLRQWKFVPGLSKDGQAVKDRIKVPIRFSLDS